LEANRRNSLKSTGPRTARGKAQSRLNAMRHGSCSPTYSKLWRALLDAPPGYPVAKTLCSMLTEVEYSHPVYGDLAEVHFEMEEQDQAYSRRIERARERKVLRELKRSQEPLENNTPRGNKFAAKPLSQ